MKYSGFFMVSADSKTEARKIFKNMFYNEVMAPLEDTHGDTYMGITDVVKCMEESYTEGKLYEYDVHFIVELPWVEFEEDTQEFYELEKLIGTGLSVVDD